MAANKSDTEAIRTFGERNYAAAPKSVMALVAYYLAQRLAEDGDRDAVLTLISEEWAALHANGIVPQKPTRFETMAQEADSIEACPVTRDDSRLGQINRERIAALRSTGR